MRHYFPEARIYRVKGNGVKGKDEDNFGLAQSDGDVERSMVFLFLFPNCYFSKKFGGSTENKAVVLDAVLLNENLEQNYKLRYSTAGWCRSAMLSLKY